MPLLAAITSPNPPPVKRLSKSRLEMQPVNNGDMSDHIVQGELVVGSGWHPALFQAEVEALTHGIEEILTPRIVRVSNSEGLDLSLIHI